ncbi:hypothetical protein PV10_04835 [Exophiala mesophila]|uniref:Uncharacterized protein n=1 Tax=Exophiala mesophila TaxID=212818 RepID=A0A0D1ZG25_EXOME|nr:uncharacterized protein PV10_04835 [Exophiala mesophila]KIV93637.1 hypothetical protein PV10_04835 [Exophiala mesophila]
MATEISESSWNEIVSSFDTTLEKLEAHRTLLQSLVPSQISRNDLAVEQIQKQLEHTLQIIVIFKQSIPTNSKPATRPVASPAPPKSPEPTEEHQAEISRGEDDKETTSTPHIPAEPTIDPSGLFSVDTNPTPIEELIRAKPVHAGKQHNDRGHKRKISQTEGAALEEYNSSEHTPKKNRGKDSTHIPEADDSFEKGVAARLKAKQDRKIAKSNKKRKRQSDSSSGPGSSSNKATQNKKMKKANGKPKANPSGTESKTNLGLRPAPKKRNSGGGAVNGDSHNQRASKRRKKSK